MATKLSIFNDALSIIGRDHVQDPDENREAPRTLRDHWTRVPRYCLEQADWHFARVRTQLARHGTTPEFGWDYYYSLPSASDNLRIVAVFDHEPSEDSVPLEKWVEENGKIATNADKIFLIYISHADIATKLGMWPEYFSGYVAAEMAHRSAAKLNADRVKDAMEELKRRRKTAFAMDASSQPPRRHTPGRWARAHRGRSVSGQSGRRTNY